jgi:hypothetical protein
VTFLPYLKRLNLDGIDYPHLSATIHLNHLCNYVLFQLNKLSSEDCLSLLGVPYKCYTQISLLHDKMDYWFFLGLLQSPAKA